MAKATQAAAKHTNSAPEKRKRTVAVTYRPLNRDDLNEIVWNKIKFLANVPVELDPNNKAHGYDIPERTESIHPGSGQTVYKYRDVWKSMIEIAKDNPSFQVEGYPRARRKISTRVVPPPGAEWTDAHEGQISESDEIDRSVAA